MAGKKGRSGRRKGRSGPNKSGTTIYIRIDDFNALAAMAKLGTRKIVDQVTVVVREAMERRGIAMADDPVDIAAPGEDDSI